MIQSYLITHHIISQPIVSGLISRLTSSALEQIPKFNFSFKGWATLPSFPAYNIIIQLCHPQGADVKGRPGPQPTKDKLGLYQRD